MRRFVHDFLKWFPVAIGGGAIAIAGVWSDARDWIGAEAIRVWSQMSDPWIAVLVVVSVAAYVAAIIWTGQERKPKVSRSGVYLTGEGVEHLKVSLGTSSPLETAFFPLPQSNTPAAKAVEQSPLLFAGFAQAKDTPKNDHTAIRVNVRNRSDQNLTGLVARLVGTATPLGGLYGAIDLPLVLGTKARLDRLRNPAINEQLPPHGFNLHAHSEKPIEVVWLHSKGALEGFITHQAGEAEFLFVGSQDFHIEVTGAGKPITAVVRINVADDDNQSWTPGLIIEAVGEAHGRK